MLAVHNTAPYKLIRAAAPYFRVKDGEDRVIINISSTSGIHGNAYVYISPSAVDISCADGSWVTRGQANYALAKAGLVGLTKTITKEWGPAYGVRANTIAFGFVKTRLTAAKEEGAFITTPDGTIWAPGDSRLIPEHHLTRPAPDALIFDFSDSEWHFGLDGAVKMANTYPATPLLLHHWGSVDAPDFAPFNADPASLHDRVDNPDRVYVLAPGAPFTLRALKIDPAS